MLELNVENEGRTVKLQFEHSLRSLSKWESKFKTSWFVNNQKTPTQLLEYYKCMLLSPEIDPDFVYLLEPKQMDQITEYINESQTASSVPKEGPTQYNPEVTTTELIYFWMIALKINWEAQDWHFSRLMMLIEITGYKQQPPKKRKPSEVMADWRAQNEKNKKILGTSG